MRTLTYLKFIQNINNVNPNQNPNAYLAQIAKNLALNEFNKQKRVIVDDAYFTNLKDQSSENGSGIDLGIILGIILGIHIHIYPSLTSSLKDCGFRISTSGAKFLAN